MNNTLLLTGCINPLKNSRHIDDREKQYIDALNYYIFNSDFKHIIFVDNSNHILPIFKKNQIINNKWIIKINNKTIEYITFDWNKLTKMYGYWYSESEILDYAMDNSVILKNMQNNESFFKITWRYIIKNINNIIKISQEQLFFRWIRWFSCITGIFKITKKDYLTRLYKKVKEFYINNPNWFITLESVYYIILRDFLYNKCKPKWIIFCYCYLNDWTIRHALPIKNQTIVKIFYGITFCLKMNQFTHFSRIIDNLFFKQYYKNKKYHI